MMSKYMKRNPIRHGLSKYDINKSGAMCFLVYAVAVFLISLWHSSFYSSVFGDDVLFLAEIFFPATLCVSVIKSNGLKFEQIPEHGNHNVKNIYVGEEIFAAYVLGGIVSAVLMKLNCSFWTCTNAFFVVSILVINWGLEMIAGWQDLAEYAQAVNLISRKCFYIGDIKRYVDTANGFAKNLDETVDWVSKKEGLRLWYLYEMPIDKQFQARKELEKMWENARENPKTWAMKKSYFE